MAVENAGNGDDGPSQDYSSRSGLAQESARLRALSKSAEDCFRMSVAQHLWGKSAGGLDGVRRVLCETPRSGPTV